MWEIYKNAVKGLWELEAGYQLSEVIILACVVNGMSVQTQSSDLN